MTGDSHGQGGGDWHDPSGPCNLLLLHNVGDSAGKERWSAFFSLSCCFMLTSRDLQPFVDDGHFVHSYFLPREYAVALPLLAVVVLFAFIGG